MTIQLLKLYLELSHLSMYKQWTYTRKQWLFFEKSMKGYFKAVILSLKIYDILAVYANTLKQSFIDLKTMKCIVIYDYAKIPLNWH